MTAIALTAAILGRAALPSALGLLAARASSLLVHHATSLPLRRPRGVAFRDQLRGWFLARRSVARIGLGFGNPPSVNDRQFQELMTRIVAAHPERRSVS